MAEDTRIVCTSCGAINRIPPGKEPTSAKCGGCRRRLFTGEPIDVDTAMLERQLSRGTIPVVVDVWAPWCGPCHAMAPQYVQAAALLEPAARFLKLNSDNEARIAQQLGIRSIPTMVAFRGGREIGRISGAMSAQQISSWIRSTLGQPS